ncbi:MAG: hypothetical protein VB070_06735 [Clostridiaceae bacterium]|nr:hypothetical protein [Clostridiaceae bacterium]
MLDIMGKRILANQSQILYDRPFSRESLNEDWAVADGEWWIEDGWLTGRIYENRGGFIYTKNNYAGDIMLDFYGRTVPPCNNDLNFTWHSQGWDKCQNDAGIGYIAGLNGWWTGKTGIEKYPECKIQATTSIQKFEAGRSYHIQAGSVQGQCFIFVDGRLAIELKDPSPIDSVEYGKVGFGTYCSYIQVRDFKLFRPATEDVSLEYTAHF